jgi:hypothetical protein
MKQKSGGPWFKASPGQIVHETLSKNKQTHTHTHTHTHKHITKNVKKGLVVAPEFKPQYRKEKARHW